MPFGDDDWCRRNPDCFKLMAGEGELRCECGELTVRDGLFYGTQDHPWRPPRVECDCGTIHQIVGFRCQNSQADE